MGGINIKKSEALEVLSMKIQYYVCWNRHIFQWLSFLFTLVTSDWECIQFSCVGKCLKVFVDINDGMVSNSIDLLELCCNLACVSRFYRYYNGFCWRTIRGIIPWHMYSYVTLAFLGKPIRMWSISQWFAHCITYKICILVGLFVCWTPSCRGCNVSTFKEWKGINTEKSSQVFANKLKI